jgi:hypothetical protein
MEDAPGVTVIEAGPEADLDRGTARGPLEGLILRANIYTPSVCLLGTSFT